MDRVGSWPLACALLAWAAASLFGCGGARGKGPELSRGSRLQPGDGYVTSNITRGDYAGSAACEPCHHDTYQAWLGSPMHRMTRAAVTAEIRAPFDGRTFRFKDDAVKLTRVLDERFMEISSPTFGHHVYRVTRVIGGRYREDFAGTEVDQARSLAMSVKDPKNELILPVTFVYSPPSFRLKGYSVMVAERPGCQAGGVWNQTCIFCHNTAPYFSSLLGELIGPSAPAYQGEVVDRLLPPDRRAHLVLTNADALLRAAGNEIRFLAAPQSLYEEPPNGSDPRSQLDAALHATQKSFDASHLVELGIGCESCHGGSREHAENPRVKPSFEIHSGFVRAEASEHDTAELPKAGDEGTNSASAVNRVCARCHQVLFSRYPFTWEGGRRNDQPGGSHISSGEARDFLLGACSSRLSCVDCHDPHAQDAPEKLRAMETPAGNVRCLSCHGKWKSEAALAEHTHHLAGGAGSACINCHMPKKNMGLAYNLTRYHRIGSPTDQVRVLQDRPLECALCHADKTTLQLVTSMEQLWGKTYDRPSLRALYGDLGTSPLLATVSRGKAHEQATAIYVLGEQRVQAALPAIAAEMVNRYPLVRYYARQALEKLTGRSCDVDLDQDDAQIRADVERWLGAR